MSGPMATTYVPELRDPVVVDGTVHRLAGSLVALALLGLLATAMVVGATRLVSTMTESLDSQAAPTAEAIIRPGNGPAVAATPRARILSVDCTLAGPVQVAADGTGAYTVTSGAGNVRCPDGRFREGDTLRWPPNHPVETGPLPG